MVDSVQDYAIFTLDPSGQVSSWGTGAERVFGYPESEIVGQCGTILWTLEDRSSGMPEKELVTAETMGRAEGERWHQRKDGSRFFASGVVTPIRGPADELLGFTKVARDVTARKLTEEALKEADQRKDEFLAMLAHELRNPLAPIANSLSLIRHQRDHVHENVRRAAAMIERQVEHMIRLVDDLLDVSRITRGLINLQRETVDLASVLNRAVESSRPIIDARQHELDIQLPDECLYVDADPVRLAQVFWNLLNNAAKYTPQGGRITVRVETSTSRTSPSSESHHNQSTIEELIVRISDTGVGIPPAMLPKVFELFTQVDRTLDRAEGGLGIGLTLVRRLVEMHGGRVEARSAGPGSGSEFEVWLPLARRDEPAPPPSIERADGRPGSETALRILIVDDNRDSAESLASLLRIEGNDVCTAYEGLQALAIAEDYQPEVILLDLGLPGINGFEVARQMRLSPLVAGSTIVAITGFGTENDRRLSKDAGFDHHLVKPVNFTALSQMLAQHTKRGAQPHPAGACPEPA
jgi:PAS domain S-box-containing protein